MFTVQTINQGYTCGLNALNIGLKWFGYNIQLTINQYPPDHVLGI